MDAVHMPQGCATWPFVPLAQSDRRFLTVRLCSFRAFWSNGPNWPAGGEIDILEGVNDQTNNQATIHTNPGCNLPSGASGQSLSIQGAVIGGTNCAAAETGNAGCGVRSNSATTYGSGWSLPPERQMLFV